MKKIAINIIATNKYITFLDELCRGISENFNQDDDITAIIYTNLDIPESLIFDNPFIKFKKSEITHEPWPFTTLRRFQYFLQEKEFLDSCDYSYYIDADSRIIRKIDDLIFPNDGTIGTIHPCLYGGVGTPERNPASKAYIHTSSNNRYYCGGFFGASGKNFTKMSEEISGNINDDLSRGIIAIWHDESHLNRYFFYNQPQISLEYPFAIGENYTGPADDYTRIVFIDKQLTGGHDFYRS
jgi:hypothetical protein